MLDRMLAACATVLAAAVAIYVAVKLIMSVATQLTIIVAALGGLIIVSFVSSALWRRHRADRWW